MGFATTETHLPVRTEDALEVRRNAGVFGLATITAVVIAIAYGWRAATAGTTALWGLVVLLGALAVFYAMAWYDARSPLLVADALGVRLRNGRQWHGLRWDDVADVVVHPRGGLFSDGEIEVVAHQGTGYIVPIGLATVCSNPDVAGTVRALTSGQTAVTVVDPADRAVPERAGTASHDSDTDDSDTDETGVPDTDTVGTVPGPKAVPDIPAERSAEMSLDTNTDSDSDTDSDTGASTDVAAPAESDPEPDAEPDSPARAPRPHTSPVALVASAGRAIRANVSRSRPGSVGTAALKADPAFEPAPGTLPQARELRGMRGRVDLVFEPLPAPTEEVAIDAAPIEEWPAQAAEDPVIGPRLAGVRERSGLTVDSLADRTRIRPHVIEAIEVDDFAPCGGDFYARGHIRSLARVLGLDAGDLVATYDEKYAQAPVDARRVFEAELATGPRPSIRLAKGGPNWAALLGVVMVLAIIWGLGQYFTGAGEAPAETPKSSTLKESGSDGGSLAGLGAPTSNDLVLRGVGADSTVVVRDDTGTVQWKGTLSDGQRKRLSVPGRATIVSEHGDAVTVRVNGDKKGTVGEADGRAKTVRGRR